MYRFTYSAIERPVELFRPGRWLKAYREIETPQYRDTRCFLSFTILVSNPSGEPLKPQAERDAAVQKAVLALNGPSLETNAIFHLNLKDGVGSCGVFEDPEKATAATLQPGEYNWLTVGVFQKGRYTFTIRGSSYARDNDAGQQLNNALTILEKLAISRSTESEVDAALLDAAYAGDLDKVITAISGGAHVDAIESRGWTPLIYAANWRCQDGPRFDRARGRREPPNHHRAWEHSADLRD